MLGNRSIVLRYFWVTARLQRCRRAALSFCYFYGLTKQRGALRCDKFKGALTIEESDELRSALYSAICPLVQSCMLEVGS